MRNIEYEIVDQFEENDCVYIIKHPKEEKDHEVIDYHRYIAEVLYSKNKEEFVQ